MSEDTNVTTESIVIERNGVKLKFIPTKKQRGADKGAVYYAPDTTNRDEYFAWLGDELMNTLVPKINQKASGWSDEATDDVTNILDVEKFTKFAQDFAARGDSKSELEDKRNDLMAEVGDMSSADLSDTTVMAKIQQLIAQVKNINLEIAAKKRKKTDVPAVA